MDTEHSEKPSAEWLTGVITNFVAASPVNSFDSPLMGKMWDVPLVGFSRGDDPVYQEFKNHIGSFFWTPQEIFQLTFPDPESVPQDLTVISWILPQTRATKDENAAQKVYPSRRWVITRDSGEKFNVTLRRHLVETLMQTGILAVAPLLSPHWSRQTSQRYGFASNWSERHAAHAGGLGTFGLCDGLITPLGKAVRAGSVVAKLTVPATPRPYQNHQEYCLFYSHDTCQECVQRCPVKALSSSGHDKDRCNQHLRSTRKYILENYSIDMNGCCGLCQVGVPCESQIPSTSAQSG